MQLWFSRGSEIPMREQLVTQMVLAILSGDLAPGDCLPSTRELARRFRIHPNTVSAGYRELEREGWVESRRGSGVYVRRSRPTQAVSREAALDRSIASLFQSARKLGVPLGVLRGRLQHWLAAQPPDRFLVIEPDAALRAIVIAEMQRVVTLPVQGCSMDECGPRTVEGAIAVVLPSKAEAVRQRLAPDVELVALQVRSIQTSLAKYLPAPKEALVGIASGWAGFLTLARTMLIASGFDEDSLLLRNCMEPGWREGLDQAAAIVCDSVTAGQLPKKPPVVCFELLAEAFLVELRRCEEFVLRADLSAPIARG